MKSVSIYRRKFLTLTTGAIGAPAFATSPIPGPLSMDSYIPVFGKLIFTGHLKRVVALPNGTEKNLRDRESKIAFSDLKFENPNENTEHAFLEIENAELRLVRTKKFTLAAIKSCSFEKIYVSSDHLRGSEEYKNYYNSLTKKDIVLFLEPPTQYIGNSGEYLDKFYYISRGPNWRDGSPLLIDDYKRIYEIAIQNEFIDAKKLPCKKG